MASTPCVFTHTCPASMLRATARAFSVSRLHTDPLRPNGVLLARTMASSRVCDDPTAHGGMMAIRRCLAEYGIAGVRGSTLYTTGEPCAMCMGAILWCRISRLVFAASVQQLAAKIDQIMISSADVAARAPFAPITIMGGVLGDEVMQLFVK